MAKKKKTPLSDQGVADLLRRIMAISLQDKSLNALHGLTGVSHAQIRQVVRSLPAEFGLYNKSSRPWVKFFEGPAGTKVRLLT